MLGINLDLDLDLGKDVDTLDREERNSGHMDYKASYLGRRTHYEENSGRMSKDNTLGSGPSLEQQAYRAEEARSLEAMVRVPRPSMTAEKINL